MASLVHTAFSGSLSLCLLVFVNVFSIALSVCPAGWAQSQGRCYYIFSTPLAKADADILCDDHAAQLVYFTSEDEWDYISTLLQAGQLSAGAWTSLNVVDGKWAWEDGASYTELHHWRNAQSGSSSVPQPTSLRSQAKMIVLGTETYMVVELADTKLYPFCVRPVDNRDLCDSNEDWTNIMHACHKYFPPATWSDAISTCTNLGGVVYTPGGAEEFIPADQLVDPNSNIWFGASYKNGGYYYETDNRPVDFLPWLTPFSNYSNPNETCLAGKHTSYGFGFYMSACDLEISFLCKRDIGTCPLGWYQDGTQCFQLHIRPEERVSWSVAVDFCRSQNAELAQDLSKDANTILYNLLAENNVHLSWLGFSGSDGKYYDLDGKKVFGNYYLFSTTTVGGGPSNCGVTDFDPRRVGLSLAAYCYTPQPFVCTIAQADTLNTTVTANFQCDAGWTLYADYCYQIVNTPLTQDGAVKNCKSLGGSILYVNSTIEQSFFSTPGILGYGLHHYWIGVKYGNETNTFVVPETGEQTHFYNLDPLYNSTLGPCVYVSSGSNAPFMGSWFADACTNTHNTVCRKPATPVTQPPASPTTNWALPCGIGWTYLPATNLCYFVSPYTHKPWREARESCLSLQGDLLSIDGKNEQLMVEGLLQSAAYNNLEESLWIGAGDMTEENGWAWSDNRPFHFLHFAEGEPSYASDDGDNCGYIPVTKNYEWETRSCGDRLGFICRKSASFGPAGHASTQAPPLSCNPQKAESLISGEHSILFPQDFSASSSKDAQHTPDKCRLIQTNTGSWSPANNSADEWLAVTFHSPVGISAIELKGEDSVGYVSKFKLQYQYDEVSPWYWYTDTDRSVMIFTGLTVPDESTTIIIPGELQAHAIKFWPVEWGFGIAVQLELKGCPEEDCTADYALGGPLFVDDASITASSQQTGFEAWNARLKSTKPDQKLSAWFPLSTDTAPWIQVDLGKNRIIQAIIVAGDGQGNFVTMFQLQLSRASGDAFIPYSEPYGTPHTFVSGTTGGSTLFYLDFSVEARLVRVVPIEWQGQPALKFDLKVCFTGCTANPVIARLPSIQLSATDSQPNHTPDRSKLFTAASGDVGDSWTPLLTTNVDSSYIQADLGIVRQIKAIATQGSESDGSWVTTYYLAFSSDGNTFTMYRAASSNEAMLFSGNFDGATVVKTELPQPVNARYIQLKPHGYQKAVSVRWELYACPKQTANSPLGCYTDDQTDPDLPVIYQPDSFTAVWPESCLSYCYDQGYRYAGLQNGYLCSCGNTYGMYGTASECNMPCQTPYFNFTCGGVNTNAIYSTGISANNYVCPTGWRSFRGSCYSLMAPATGTYTMIACHRVQAQVVDISDMAENEFVASIIGDNSLKEFSPVQTGNDAWLGLSDLNSDLTFGWKSGARVNFTNWGRHEPTVNPSPQQHGVIISADGGWSNVFVDEVHSVICERAKIPSSDPEANSSDIGCQPQWRAAGLKCYRYYRLNNTWTEAQTFCASQNSSLARADGRSESLVISAALSQLDGSYWLDVHDDSLTGLYTHSTGKSQVLFANWAVRKPDASGACVSAQTGQYSGEWSNDDCQNGNRFVCEQPRTGYFPMPVTTPSTSLPCPTGWEPQGYLCYQPNIVDDNSLLTWHEANENCVLQGATLASFHSDTDFNAIVSKFRQNNGNIWIGLNNLDPTTGFSWSDESVMNFVTWGTGQPRPAESLSTCGEIQLDTKKMGLQACTEKRSWMCTILRGQSVKNITRQVIPPPENYGSCHPLTGNWLKYKDYCYYISSGDGETSDAKTWRESRQWCGQQGGDLASVTSADENAFIYGQLNQGIPVEAAWIGLNELDRYSGYSWSDGAPVGTWPMNWNVNEPDDYNGFEGCVEMLARNGRWNDDHCSTRQGFVCKQPAPGVNVTKPPDVTPRDGNCPPDFYRFGYKCYIVQGVHGDLTKQSWTDARSTCQYLVSQPNYKVDIASITSPEENALITTLLAEYRMSAWVGLRRVAGGQFMWADNEDLGFEGWSRDEPDMPPGNDSCVYVDGRTSFVGKWSDVPCEEKNAFVCQGFVDPAFPVILRPPPPQCNITDGFQFLGTSCYKVYNQTVTWQEARASCQGSRATLASVMDGFDWAELYLLGHGYSGGVWIGLNDLTSPGLYTWDSGFQVTYTRWAQQQPANYGGCVYMDASGLFNDVECAQLRSFVCRSDTKPPEPVPDQYEGFCSLQDFDLFCSTCYLLMPSAQLTYAQAGRECALRGATLATISTLTPAFNIEDTQRVWIGLRNSLDEGFSWEDSSVLDFTNWGPGSPDWSGDDALEKGCVVMMADSRWKNVDCQDLNGYLCSVPAVPYQTGSTPTNGGTLAPAGSINPMCMSTSSTTPPRGVSTVPPHSGPTNPPHTGPTTPPHTGPTAIPPPHGETTTGGSRNATASPQHIGSGGLTPGDEAGIVIGVLFAVACIVVFVIVVYRKGNWRSSFLRREASRVKNFENSLYAETRKDTLAKSDNMEGINIVDNDPRKLSVTYSVMQDSSGTRHYGAHSFRDNSDQIAEFTGDPVDESSDEVWSSGAHGFEGFEDSMAEDDPGYSLAGDTSGLDFSLARGSDDFTYSLAGPIDEFSFHGPHNPNAFDGSDV